jgi:hypothetical protein
LFVPYFSFVNKFSYLATLHWRGLTTLGAVGRQRFAERRDKVIRADDQPNVEVQREVVVPHVPHVAQGE